MEDVISDVPSWIEEMGSSPAININTAFEIGLEPPEIKYYLKLSEAEQAEMFESHEWIFIEDFGIAIKKIDGIRMSLCSYFNGVKFIAPVLLFNDPYMKDGGQGPAFTANCVTCFFNRHWLCKDHFRKLGAVIRANDVDFTGWVNIDIVYSGDKIYYQTIRPGLLFDYAVCIAHLFGLNIEKMVDEGMTEDMQPQHNFTCSLRGYDYMNNVERFFFLFPDLSENPYITDIHECYSILGEGENIRKAWAKLYDRVPIRDNPDFCYRLDGKRFSLNCFKSMREAGLI